MGSPSHADGWDDSDGDAWAPCGKCHGMDGAGNHIKFPRLAGQKASYIVKQLRDFRDGLRRNEGGQMEKTAGEISSDQYESVARWFESQTPPPPRTTLEIQPDLQRARDLAYNGIEGKGACMACHGGKLPPAFAGKSIVVPRIAGQWDYYLAKQLRDYRDGRRGEHETDQIMIRIARRLSDEDILNLAAFFAQNPGLQAAP